MERCVGTDTGGTFTDVVTGSGRVAKVSSNPADPAEAVKRALAGVRRLSATAEHDRPAVLAHGTTVATNALLERAGAAVALVTTAGFEDVVEIARQARPSLYDAEQDRPEPLVRREWRIGVGGRLDATGTEIVACKAAEIPVLDPTVEAVAVCLLHADLNGDHERAVAAELRARGHDVSESHVVSPEFREYERTVTTVVNAYLRPMCRRYLRALSGLADQVRVMTSAGGLLDATEAGELPAALLLSGPAGGVVAAAAAATAAGFANAVTFDMGGTSTDVCLVRGGQAEPAAWREVAGLPVRLASLDVHTIGAGGGSIACIDAGGALTVGPRSAGAVPGPACYGRGGVEATVTDANVVLGRIPADTVMGDLGRIDVDSARTALAAAGVTPHGVVAVVNAAMEQAVRRVTVERGVDPRELALVAFGGAGPLHAAELAESLGMSVVVVPDRAGVLSAVGLLGAPPQRDLVRSWPGLDDLRGLDDAVAALCDAAVALLGAGSVAVTVEASIDARYRGQSHELTVAFGGSAAVAGDFAAAHARRNGFDRPGAAVEVVAMRARAFGEAALRLADLPARPRRGAVGPAVVAEEDCTIWVPAGWVAEPGGGGSLVLRRVAS